VDTEDEVPKHRFRNVKVGDHPIPHRPYGNDIARRSPKHLFGFRADRQDLLFPFGILMDGNDRGFIENNAFSSDIHECVGRPQINRQIVGKLP